MINGPISKKHFLKKKFPGITEYIAFKTNKNDNSLKHNKSSKTHRCDTNNKSMNQQINKRKTNKQKTTIA